jgi:hypothetical protein
VEFSPPNWKSSFSAGDEPVILVRKTTNVTISQVLTTVGSCAQFDTGTTAEKEFLTYMQTKVASAGKVVSGAFTSQWYGNDLGPVKVTKEKDIEIISAVPITGVGVLGVTYNSDFIAYRLVGVPATLNGTDTFNVLVAFIGDSA